jgi:hypothetical protein
MRTKEQPTTMLRSLRDFIGYPLEATDGKIGKCGDFLFDNEHWTVRYLVADTRKWLPGRQVLISPYQFGEPDLGLFPINLTKERIKDSPPVDTNAPVSRLYELEMARFYNQQAYWVGTGTWGNGFAPVLTNIPSPSDEEWEEHAQKLRNIDQEQQHRLYSANEIMGYALSTVDGEIGHVQDFVVESLSWTIRWMIVDTGNWLPGKKVIVSPEWIKDMDWHKKRVSVDLLSEQVKTAPEFDHRIPINRDYEGRLCDFYGKPVYW